MALQRRRRAILQALKPQTPPAAPSLTPIRLRGLQIKPTTCRHFSPFTWSCAPHDHVKAMKRWQICSRLYASGQRVSMGLPPASITGVCGGGILPEHGRTARISTVAACATESIVMSMRWHLLDGQGGLPNSASKTTPQPANPRRMPLCHPDHHLKRKERRQAVGPVRAPLKRMGVRLGTTHLSRIVSNNFVQRGRRPPCV